MKELLRKFMLSFRQTIRLTEYIDTEAAERSIRSNIYNGMVQTQN